MKWFKKDSCRSHRACVDCRTSHEFRASLARKGWVPDADFACPQGVTSETAQAAVSGRIAGVARKKGCSECPPVVVLREGVESNNF